jgi:RNA polymerase sigma factor (TIGR02999 family)
MDQVVDSAPAADSGITQLLHQWSDGRDDAFRELLSVAYTRLRSIAGACMSSERPDSTLQPTALVGELYLRLAGAKLSDWKDREHFYSFCARAMRWILTDHARARIREERRIGRLLPFTKDIRWLGEREEDAFDLDRALSRLEEIDRRKAKVIELRVYLGCSAEETAGVLNLSKATVDRDMKLACAFLCRELRPEK